MKKIFLELLVGCSIIFFFINDNVLSQDTKKTAEILKPLLFSDDPLTEKQEKETAEYLIEGTKIYIKKLKKISFFSFENRNDISAKTAVLLKTEADDLISAMEIMLENLDTPVKSPDVRSAVSWLIVVRQIAVYQSYMNDLENSNIIDSDWPTALRVMLPSIIDQILATKTVELVVFRLKSEKSSK